MQEVGGGVIAIFFFEHLRSRLLVVLTTGLPLSLLSPPLSSFFSSFFKECTSFSGGDDSGGRCCRGVKGAAEATNLSVFFFFLGKVAPHAGNTHRM
jgi:hypothetical protein